MWNKNQKEYESPFDNTANKFFNKVFQVQAYEWNEDIEQQFNFKYKDIKISWYKYLGRDTTINKEITPEEAADMFNDCINSSLVDLTGPLKEAIVTAVSEACKDLGIKLVTVIVESSYYICLLVGLSSIFLYYFAPLLCLCDHDFWFSFSVFSSNGGHRRCTLSIG